MYNIKIAQMEGRIKQQMVVPKEATPALSSPSVSFQRLPITFCHLTRACNPKEASALPEQKVKTETGTKGVMRLNPQRIGTQVISLSYRRIIGEELD